MGEVDGDAGEFGAVSFDLTGVDPDPDVDADLAYGVADRGAATDGAGGAGEGGKDAVTGELLLVAREPRLRTGPPPAMNTCRIW